MIVMCKITPTLSRKLIPKTSEISIEPNEKKSSFHLNPRSIKISKSLNHSSEGILKIAVVIGNFTISVGRTYIFI